MIMQLKKLKCGKVYEDVDFVKITSYKLKGKAKCVVYPNDMDDLKKLLNFLQTKKLKYKVIGGGSNLIFTDDYDGVLIKLNHFDDLKVEDTKIIVGAGYSLIKMALKASKLGLTGLEFATGIPGTVGGAIVNNAGAYKSDMGYVVNEVLTLTPDLEIKKFYNKEADFHYRTSFFKKNPGYTILQATIIVKRGKKENILEVIEDRKQRRLIAQPLEYPSAGSVFRNPPGEFAGKLIEDVGLKGKRVGGAKVSEKHANFIVNVKEATGADIVTLIQEIQTKIKQEYDIDLVLEQEIVR